MVRLMELRAIDQSCTCSKECSYLSNTGANTAAASGAEERAVQSLRCCCAGHTCTTGCCKNVDNCKNRFAYEEGKAQGTHGVKHGLTAHSHEVEEDQGGAYEL